MKITCPKCRHTLNINNKIQKGIQHLSADRVLRLNCPECAESITLSPSNLPATGNQGTVPAGASIKPPLPPDISWLKDGLFEEEEVIEDIPQTLILISPGPKREAVAEAVEAIGYQATFVASAAVAIEKMQFTSYACVILHNDFETGNLNTSTFHQMMRTMSMQKRRFIFYILIGSKFSTLYDLEALAYSANLVVNDSEIPELRTILRKAMPRYEELFGSLMAEISAYGG